MIDMPGLVQRRGMAGATSAVSGGVSPQSDGLLLNFASSLIQSEAEAQAAGLVAASPAQSKAFNAWIKASVALHNRAANGNRWGSFALLSLGADYLVNEQFLVGLALHIDRINDPSGTSSLLDGTGWLAGPYLSLELGESVFLDASLLYGGSQNIVDTAFFDGQFATSRWMADVALSGQWLFEDGLQITPQLRAVYLREQVSDYVVANAGGFAFGIVGQASEQLQVSTGAELQRRVDLANGLSLTPRLGSTVGLSGLGSGSAFGTLSAGLALAGDKHWLLDGSAQLNVTDRGAHAVGGRVKLSSPF
ncbi:outer membrane autotransporter barrel domain-containing protein [Devosia sp. YR412]|nr:outer membrane autotransporter barrel domain-containing protein [Devosia sp. YR412]